ncbi:unnamed protein product, partial [Schistosoma turkestanicum]
VASRDKRFFSRQSSNTSKSSFVSGTSITSVNSTNQRKLTTATINFPIPLLRVLESSHQDIRMDFDNDTATTTNNHNIDNHQSSGKHSRHEKQNSLLVPLIDRNENGFQYSSSTTATATTTTTTTHLKTISSHNNHNEKNYALHERSNSISLLPATSPTPTSPTSTSPTTGTNLKLSSTMMNNIPKRRKSTNDLFTALFPSRSQHDLALNRTNEDSILLQVLRRQHKKTLRILIILLLVFIVCRAPRSLILIIQWLQETCLQKKQSLRQLDVYIWWLQYTSIFAYSSAIFDTIVYGFWGNRIYRLYMKNLFSTHCALQKYCCFGCD